LCCSHLLSCVLLTLGSKHQPVRWNTTPRVVVHDKASYMVSGPHNRLHMSFASALNAGSFKSWVGDARDSTQWLASKWGDVYVPCNTVRETFTHFRARMQRVEDHMNSDEFAATNGGGLRSLATRLRDRCRDVIARQGERIPK
jgi:hypothetical protein